MISFWWFLFFGVISFGFGLICAYLASRQNTSNFMKPIWFIGFVILLLAAMEFGILFVNGFPTPVVG